MPEQPPMRKQPPPPPQIAQPWQPAAGPGYAELHCHTNFSFLDGASHAEELVEEAVRLGLSGLAVTDHDGLYGAVRYAEAAATTAPDAAQRAANPAPLGFGPRSACRGGLPTVFGAELTIGRERPPNGVADPPGEHLVILAENTVGYARLARAISEAQMAGEKGVPHVTLSLLADIARAAVHAHPQASAANDSWFVLTGCRKGGVPHALVAAGPAAARRRLDELVTAFGRDRVLVELWDHGDPLDRVRNDGLAEVAAHAGVDVIATNNVHYATVNQRPLATALAAIRSSRSLDELDGWLPANSCAHLRSPAEQHRRFARYPGAVARTVDIAAAAAFDLRLAAPNLPDFPVPPGHDEMSWLRELTRRGAGIRYPPHHARHHQAMQQLDYELGVIDRLGFAGYFLLVYDIVEFCRRADIYCQGRGSAANSAVCYAIGVTKADAVTLGLLFERFLSPERDGPPDIDLDIEHERREEVIQYVYEKYGRDRAAQVANVITYRPRSAIREMAKACGLSPGQADALTKHLDAWRMSEAAEQLDDEQRPIPPLVLDLAKQVQGYPRHLGIHSGGMVIADRPLVEFCPVEWGRMANRSVLQWDKDDCAAAGLVKFDLLGLGMLTMLHLAVDLVRSHRGVVIDLATIPQEDAVYDLLCRADTVGVFQVESRAQMATLPRLKPRAFYDLVVEVALIRPGPVQGNSVHPYLRRRNGEEAVTYLHPLLEKSLEKTLGVPIFQEQLMQMAVDVAGFSPGEADQLRQAMGSKRSRERMARMRVRLMEGMAKNGIAGAVADEIAHKLEAFADFGFPESHSVSFAYLVYSSAWMKLHYSTEFTCALLNAQPMGFYSPYSLIRDGHRHGVDVLGPDVNASQRNCTIEKVGPEGSGTIRIGLRYVRNLGTKLLDTIDAERERASFASIEEFVRRTAAPTDAVEALATAGAFRESFALDRRPALWAAGALRDARAEKLPGIVTGIEAPPLPGMTVVEETSADLWAMSLSPSSYPTEFVRDQLDARGVVRASDLQHQEHNSVVEVAGIVTHRQRPETAHGVIFMNLEDETGLVNVICLPAVWKRYRRTGRNVPALVIRGLLEYQQGTINLVAHRLEPLSLKPAAALRSRDFR